jgi:hypothetical protein
MSVAGIPRATISVLPGFSGKAARILRKKVVSSRYPGANAESEPFDQGLGPGTLVATFLGFRGTMVISVAKGAPGVPQQM